MQITLSRCQGAVAGDFSESSCTLCRNRTVSLTADHQGAQTHRDRPGLSGTVCLREALAFAITGRKVVLSELHGDAVAILTQAHERMKKGRQSAGPFCNCVGSLNLPGTGIHCLAARSRF